MQDYCSFPSPGYQKNMVSAMHPQPTWLQWLWHSQALVYRHLSCCTCLGGHIIPYQLSNWDLVYDFQHLAEVSFWVSLTLFQRSTSVIPGLLYLWNSYDLCMPSSLGHAFSHLVWCYNCGSHLWPQCHQKDGLKGVVWWNPNSVLHNIYFVQPE